MAILSRALLTSNRAVEKYVEDVRGDYRVGWMLGSEHVLVREVRDVERQIHEMTFIRGLKGASGEGLRAWARRRVLKCVRVRLVFCMMAEVYRRDPTKGAEYQAFFGMLDAQIRGTLARFTMEPYKFKYWRDVAEEEEIPVGDGYDCLYEGL